MVPLDLGQFSGLKQVELDLLVASPRAARALQGLDLPPTWRVLALAPRTAETLRALGVPVHLEVEGGGRELARAARLGAVVFLRSDLGGDEVLAIRPDARSVIAYHTRCPDALPEVVARALSGDQPYALHVGSPSAVHHLELLWPGALARAAVVYARGRTTVEALARIGVSALPPAGVE